MSRDHKTISYRPPTTTHDRIQEYAAATHRRSLNEVVEVLVLDALTRWETNREQPENTGYSGDQHAFMS